MNQNPANPGRPVGFLRSLLSVSSGTAATIGFHFLSMMILTRGLSRELFGLYILALVVVQALKIVGGLGLDLTVVKYHTGSGGSKYFGTILWIRVIMLLGLAGIFLLTGTGILRFVFPDLVPYGFYLSFLFLVHSLREFLFHALQAEKKFKAYATIQVLSAAAKFTAIAACFLGWRLTLSLLFQIEIFVFLMSIVFQLLSLKSSRTFSWLPARQEIGEITRFSFPLYLNNLITFVYDRINVVLIGLLMNPASVAVYEVAYKIPEALLRLYRAFIVVYFPGMSERFNNAEEERARHLFSQSFAAITFLALSGTIGSFLFRHEIVTVLFSSRYAAAATAFFLLMINFYLRASANLMGYTLVSAGYSSIPVKVNTVASLVNIVASLLLIPRFGVLGAVLALVSMNLVSLGFYLVFLKRRQLFPETNLVWQQLGLFLFTLILSVLSDHAPIWWRGFLLMVFPLLCMLGLPDFRRLSRQHFRSFYSRRSHAEPISPP